MSNPNVKIVTPQDGELRNKEAKTICSGANSLYESATNFASQVVSPDEGVLGEAKEYT